MVAQFKIFFGPENLLRRADIGTRIGLKISRVTFSCVSLSLSHERQIYYTTEPHTGFMNSTTALKCLGLLFATLRGKALGLRLSVSLLF